MIFSSISLSAMRQKVNHLKKQVSLFFDPELLQFVDEDIQSKRPAIRSRNEWFDATLRELLALKRKQNATSAHVSRSSRVAAG